MRTKIKIHLFNKALRILLTTNGLILVAAAMLGPIYALFVEQIGGNLLDASLTGGMFALAAGVTTLLSGKYADRIQRDELIVVVGYTLIGIGFLFYTAVESILPLLLVQVLIGFGEAVYSPAFDALYSSHLSEHKVGREWGAWESMNYFTAAGGAIFGGLIAANFGFDALFVIMALICFGSAAYIYLLPHRAL